MPNEGFNPFPGFINAETTCDLQAANTDGLQEGCLAFVRTPIIFENDPNLGPFHYYRYTTIDTVLTPALPVDGVLVLAAYNSQPARQQPSLSPYVPGSVGALCAPIPDQVDAHQPGPARWILVDISDFTVAP
jgi:hypothetical protein